MHQRLQKPSPSRESLCTAEGGGAGTTRLQKAENVLRAVYEEEFAPHLGHGMVKKRRRPEGDRA